MASSKRLLLEAQTRTVGRTWELTALSSGLPGAISSWTCTLACWPSGLLWCKRVEHKRAYPVVLGPVHARRAHHTQAVPSARFYVSFEAKMLIQLIR